jgi:GNAT superfamily N-acetyltransferase
LPEARRQGVGQALVRWAIAQAERLLIMATPGAAEFYAHMLPDAQRNGLEFIVTSRPSRPLSLGQPDHGKDVVWGHAI